MNMKIIKKDVIDIRKCCLSNSIKLKYFVAILSNEENLQKCLNNKIAGFPETDNGKWAYIDINVGDYISFYYNGRLYNLYKVEGKYIPEQYLKKEAYGSEEYDPEPLNSNGDKWKAIQSKKQFIYFPYRLKLNLIKESNFFTTSVIFKQGAERLGINLIPRISFKKTHFQLTLEDAEDFFKINFETKQRNLLFNDFIISFRDIHRKETINSLGEITSKETFLQSLIKYILEASISKWGNKILSINENEIEKLSFLSEQTVYGGEADITITNQKDNCAFIEVKNTSILNKKGGNFTNKGNEAYEQVMKYKDIINPKKSILKMIGGKKEFGSTELLMRFQIKDNVYVIETNTRFNIA